MTFVNRILDVLRNPIRRIPLLILKHTAWLLPDELFLKLKYRFMMGRSLNLKNPKTFNEKIQWLKLYDRKPEYTTMVDKYAVKEYVANIIGKEYIIPTLGVWESPDNIDWDSMPNQFVLKTTHGGGSLGIVICKNKDELDKKNVSKKINKSLKQNIYRQLREWPYKNVKRRIIAEKYMSDDTTFKTDDDLADYKFYCFGGEPKYCQVIRNRRSNETIDFYDMEWNHMPFVGLNRFAGNGILPVAKPVHLDTMIKICRNLSNNIPFVRVDLYIVNDKVYFGEITFYPASGIGIFTPEEWMMKLGDMIKLPLPILL